MSQVRSLYAEFKKWASMHQLHGSVKKPDTWAYSDAVIANADFCYSCWMVLNLWRTVIAVLMVFLCVCFPGPTPSSDYGSTTLPPNAAGTTFTCTTATPSTPPSSLLSGTSRSLCVDRLSWSHICFLSISNIAKYLVFWAWKSLRHHFSHMIFNLSIETQTKDVFFFYSARWNSIKRRDLQTSEPNTFSISPEKDSVTFQNSLTFNHMSASN